MATKDKRIHAFERVEWNFVRVLLSSIELYVDYATIIIIIIVSLWQT